MTWGTSHRILSGGEGQRDELLSNEAIGMPWRVLYTRETRFRSKGTSGRKRSLENPRQGPLLPILSLLSGSLFCCLTASNAWKSSLRMSSRSLAALAKLWVTTGSERWTIRAGVGLGLTYRSRSMSSASSWLVSGSRIISVWAWWFQLLLKAETEEDCKFKAKLGD